MVKLEEQGCSSAVLSTYLDLKDASQLVDFLDVVVDVHLRQLFVAAPVEEEGDCLDALTGF